MSAKIERRNRNDQRRVLVVDDEADIRELLDMTLARMGLAADCAGSVAEGMAKLEHGVYDLCLTDMRLPDGEGLQLVRRIGECHPELPPMAAWKTRYRPSRPALLTIYPNPCLSISCGP
jgi:two-component system response regulator PilR (NtrC family)